MNANISARIVSARIVLASALFTAQLLGSARAEEASFASEAARGAHSSARLLSAGPPSGGVYRAGVEIALDPHTITYWRQPGDAGAPPVFDFSASENVAAAEALYPVPKHLVDAGIEVAGYDDSVIFPVHVTAKDAKKPVLLKLTLDYAACSAICQPAKARLSLALPLAGASPHATRLEAAEALAPRRIAEAEVRGLVALTRAGEGVWRLRYLGPGRATDVFIEAPEPAIVDSARNEAGDFDLKLAAGERNASIAARATIRTDAGGIELPLLLQ